MKPTRLLVLLITVLFAFSAPPKKKIKYVFKAGDQYSLAQNVKSTIKQSLMGTEQTIETLSDNIYTIKVAELTPTGARLEVSFSSVKSDMKSMMGNVNMDSGGDTTKIENKVLRSILNRTFNLFITTEGRIEKMEGVENLYGGFKSAGMNEEMEKSMKQSFEQFLGEAAMKTTFEQAFPSYPGDVIKEGDTWNIKNENYISFPITSDNNWSVGELTSDAAKLRSEGTTSTDKDKVIALPQGLKAKADLAGKQASKSNMSLKSGWPYKVEILAELTGNMTLLAGGMIPEDMVIPMEVVSETSYTFTKK